MSRLQKITLFTQEEAGLLPPKSGSGTHYCSVCGKWKKWKQPKTCSFACGQTLRVPKIIENAKQAREQRPKLVCVTCGKEFTKRLRSAKTCSPECALAARRAWRAKNLVHHYCKTCGKEIPRSMKHKRSGNFPVTCSEECARKRISDTKKGKNNPAKRPEVRKKIAETVKAMAPELSARITALHQAGKINYYHERADGPNGFESKIIEFLKEQQLPFRFVGEGSFWIGPCQSGKRRNPDFIHTTTKAKLAILAHGTYWHRDDLVNQEELKDYESKGWKCFVIWDTDDLSNKELPQNIRKWAGSV
jgi:hypothetical protein